MQTSASSAGEILIFSRDASQITAILIHRIRVAFLLHSIK
ncbi:hypothetical protein SAMN05421639_102379 [Chryseobacterium shigense]|uniref:Uncharacterized protein n=1 Tax=Chryseobacterium shigense TaxID=297244 RepID=A0A1N7I6U3_9FLAO|nr:hypothetical protein SAMN05421639_102379 [Chryseobacterium shigense]